MSLSTSSTLQRKEYYQGCLPNNFSWISKRNINLICLQTILFLTPKNNLVVRQPSHLTQSHLIQLVQALIHLFFSHPMCNSRVQKCFVGCSSWIYSLLSISYHSNQSPSFFIWTYPTASWQSSISTLTSQWSFSTQQHVCALKTDESISNSLPLHLE